MRLVGCLSLFLCVALLGLTHKKKLEQNSKQWLEMKELLILCMEELQINQENSEVILQKIHHTGFHCQLLEEAFSSEGTLQQRLIEAAESMSDKKLQEVARRFALRFGMSSLSLQLEHLQSLLLVCTEEYTRCNVKAQKDGLLTLKLGILVGSAIFVILL